jgi:hypothetical protein
MVMCQNIKKVCGVMKLDLNIAKDLVVRYRVRVNASMRKQRIPRMKFNLYDENEIKGLKRGRG